MTLPEIPKEETNEKPTKPCPNCGKECKNLTVHMRYCKDRMAMTQETISKSPKISPNQTPAEPITSPLSISEVQPYIGDMVAWYQTPDREYFLIPYYIGMVKNIPFVLVQCEDGALVPPSAITGFVGMYPENKTFPETKTDDEPFPPFEVEEEKEEVKPIVLADKISFNPECAPQGKPKKSWWPFGNKKTAQPKTKDKDKEDLMKLVEGAINVTG